MSLEKIIAAASTPAAKNGAGHSELYEWFWAHFDDLLPNLVPPRTPNWNRIAAEFATLAERGEPVRDGGGQPPKAITCRQTWAKVVRDKERVSSGALPLRRQRQAPLVQAIPDRPTPTPGNHPPPVTHSEPEPADEDADGFVLQLAGGPKTWTPKKETDDV